MAKPSEHFNEQVILESEGSRRVQLVADARGIFFDGVVKALTLDFKRVQVDPTAPGRVLIQTNEAVFAFVMQKAGHATRLVDVLRVPPWMLQVTPSDEVATNDSATTSTQGTNIGLWFAVALIPTVLMVGSIVALITKAPAQNVEAETQRAIDKATAQVAEAVASAKPVVATTRARYSVSLVEEATQTAGGLPETTARALLRLSGSAFGPCFAASPVRGPETFTLHAVVGPDGRVSTVTAESPIASDCIADITRRWNYPRNLTATTINATYRVTPVP